MSKRLIFNSNEVATHGDVQNAQDWVSRDIGRVLEGLSLGTFDTSPASGVTGVAVVSGLDVTLAPLDLSLKVSPGSALFSFSGVDATQDSPYRLGVLDSETSLSFPSSPTHDQWHIVEATAVRSVVQDLRDVSSPSGLTPTSVPKLEVFSISVRVRTGFAASTDRMPRVQAGLDWVPLAAFRVRAGEFYVHAYAVIDLRKLLGNLSGGQASTKPQLSGPVGLSVRVDDSFVYVNRLSATLGGYSGPVSNTFIAQSDDPVRLILDAANPMTPHSWSYVYAFRPSLVCGLTALGFTSVAPNLDGGRSDAMTPLTPFSAPYPWDELVTADNSVYLGAVLPYYSASGFTIRLLPSLKTGGFTSQSYMAYTPGAAPLVDSFGNDVIAVDHTLTSIGFVFDPYSLLLAPFSQPASAIGVRLQVTVRAVADVILRFSTNSPGATLTDYAVLYSRSFSAGESVDFTIDVSSFPSKVLVETSSGSGILAKLTVRAVGFYEAY